MRATYTALPVWPYQEQPQRADRFKANKTQTLRLLEREIDQLGGRDVLIGVGVAPGNVRLDGGLKADARYLHAGAEVSFDVPEGSGWRRLTFHTDAFRSFGNKDSFESNLRAIALGLEALRTVDRYGIARTGQQYAGFAALPAPDDPVIRGRKLVERFGSVNEALRRTHPDTGADPNTDDFSAVIAFRDAQR